MLAHSFFMRAIRRPSMLLAAGVVSVASTSFVSTSQAQVRFQLEDEAAQAARASQAEVQQVAFYHGCRPHCQCPQCQQGYPQGYMPYPQGTMPGYQAPPAYQTPPGTPGAQTPMTPGTESPMAQTPSPSDMAPSGLASADLGQSFGGASASPTAAYIDDARVWNIARFRFDAGFDNEFPDRAEFFYAQCGCFPGAPGPGDPGPPPEAATSVDFREYQFYLEVMVTERFSLFIDTPVRSIDPKLSDASQDAGVELFDSATGISDIQAGFKLALVACPWHYDTIQLRVYTPTGQGDEGLGTDHVSIEPAYLAYRELSDRCRINGEFRVWVPISDTRLDDDTSDFDGELWAGTVLRYGIGVTYDLHQTCDCCCNITSRCSAVFEAVGWSVLDGLKFNPDVGILDASGDNIFNLKLGARWTHCNTSLYAGYGHAVTDEAWYRDVIRAELAYLY